MFADSDSHSPYSNGGAKLQHHYYHQSEVVTAVGLAAVAALVRNGETRAPMALTTY